MPYLFLYIIMFFPIGRNICTNLNQILCQLFFWCRKYGAIRGAKIATNTIKPSILSPKIPIYLLRIRQCLTEFHILHGLFPIVEIKNRWSIAIIGIDFQIWCVFEGIHYFYTNGGSRCGKLTGQDALLYCGSVCHDGHINLAYLWITTEVIFYCFQLIIFTGLILYQLVHTGTNRLLNSGRVCYTIINIFIDNAHHSQSVTSKVDVGIL